MQRSGQMPKGNPGAAFIKVKNTTNANLSRFAAVAIDGPVFTPQSSEASGTKKSQFWTNPLLKAVDIEANETKNIAILAEPIAQNGVGSAVLSGITAAVVSKPSSGSNLTTAKTVAGGLELSSCGGISVIWYDASGSGQVAAILDLGSVFNAASFSNYDKTKQQALTHSGTPDDGCLSWVDIEDCT